MRIVVLGATGSLGSALVEALASHDVVAVSRSGAVRADVATGEGLAEAFEGAEAVIDATNAREDAQRVLVDGTRRVLDAAAGAKVKHFVGISIVGIDDAPIAYYRVKRAQEELIERSPVPWSLLRTTQFNELIPRIAAGRMGVAVLPRGWKVQPIDVREVAAAMAEAVVRPAVGRLPDMGGPEILDFAAIARAWRKAAGKRGIVLAVPLPGARGRFLRAGKLCTPDRAVGKVTFAAWLAARYPRK